MRESTWNETSTDIRTGSEAEFQRTKYRRLLTLVNRVNALPNATEVFASAGLRYSNAAEGSLHTTTGIPVWNRDEPFCVDIVVTDSLYNAFVRSFYAPHGKPLIDGIDHLITSVHNFDVVPPPYTCTISYLEGVVHHNAVLVYKHNMQGIVLHEPELWLPELIHTAEQYDIPVAPAVLNRVA